MKQVQTEHIFAIFEVIKTGCIVVDQDDRNHLRTGTHLGVVIKGNYTQKRKCLVIEVILLTMRQNRTKGGKVHREASFLHKIVSIRISISNGINVNQYTGTRFRCGNL